jgi:hypothetical protein
VLDPWVELRQIVMLGGAIGQSGGICRLRAVPDNRVQRRLTLCSEEWPRGANPGQTRTRDREVRRDRATRDPRVTMLNANTAITDERAPKSQNPRYSASGAPSWLRRRVR